MDWSVPKLWHYLTHEQVSALDVLILTIVGSFFTWILSVTGKFLGGLLLKGVINLYRFIRRLLRKLHRKYINHKPTMNDYIFLKDKVDKGEKLKWYERKKYENAMNIFAKRFSNCLKCLKM
ncbi:hypothetical protein ACQKJG_23210 [Priestia megaterium]|uniref:hypothetical protein n=1 Tax=Priestia TaxID=2800373 RepID=UPI001C8DC119|nr:hypothetical protein [Priestia aryabhattai]MBY0029882.1 hypothetical protein [Priestia aryabhattai]